MSDQQWHVFYRTTGMQETKQRGFLRADFLAESARAALESLLASKQNVLHARVYPGAAAFVVGVKWMDPTIVVTHDPHPTTEEVTGELSRLMSVALTEDAVRERRKNSDAPSWAASLASRWSGWPRW